MINRRSVPKIVTEIRIIQIQLSAPGLNLPHLQPDIISRIDNINNESAERIQLKKLDCTNFSNDFELLNFAFVTELNIYR